MARSIRPDRDGMREMLKSAPVQATVTLKAAEVAGVVESLGPDSGDGPVPVISGAFPHADRAGASVTLAHASGINNEAKHGYLVRAAAALGLDVTEESA